jgi:hypothetical protein
MRIMLRGMTTQPASAEGATLFRSMEAMLTRYARGERPAGGQDAGQGPAVTRDDAIAAAHMVAGFIAASTDPRVRADPGAAAAALMVLAEFIAPEVASLDPAGQEALASYIDDLRAAGA